MSIVENGKRFFGNILSSQPKASAAPTPNPPAALRISSKRLNQFNDNLKLIAKAFKKLEDDTNFHFTSVRKDSELQNKTMQAWLKFESTIGNAQICMLQFLTDYSHPMPEDEATYAQAKKVYFNIIQKIRLKLRNINSGSKNLMDEKDANNLINRLCKPIPPAPPAVRTMLNYKLRADGSCDSVTLKTLLMDAKNTMNDCNGLFSITDLHKVKAALDLQSNLGQKEKKQGGKTVTYKTSNGMELYQRYLRKEINFKGLYESIEVLSKEKNAYQKIKKFIPKKFIKTFNAHYPSFERNLSAIESEAKLLEKNLNALSLLKKQLKYGASNAQGTSIDDIADFVGEFKGKYNLATSDIANAENNFQNCNSTDQERLTKALSAKVTTKALYDFLNQRISITRSLKSKKLYQDQDKRQEIIEQIQAVDKKIISNIKAIQLAGKNAAALSSMFNADPKIAKAKEISTFTIFKAVCVIVGFIAKIMSIFIL